MAYSPPRSEQAALALAQDMESLGLTVDDLRVSGPIDSKRTLARAQSAQVMSKKFIQRDRVKQRMMEEEARLRQQKMNARRRQEGKWNQKMQNSPFKVNLVAESERCEEEHKVRLTEEVRQQRQISRRQEAAKQDIVLRALQEESDLEALRREKRAIVEEERRLKALLDLEKTKKQRKADRIAARRAEKMRHETKKEYRRQENLEALEDIRVREVDILKQKHALPPPSTNTFDNFE
uniref:Uncharacterized protein n=1 Tax=Rhizochromulina marina TaxID=1034831 RepID=A0A7S2SUX2_9STRA|mmetsp:Transcript_8826/g.25138  ORF Transcript_8826/g.25138 Transcript_8826/m.25138 type:complete len:236 (+) Transcript_8826:126-833(+)|eukprot:CAMPEP_0118984882 /NCGR_PEP_ID=MMETSP1173-20130426/38683_1 /TAXON_ID=1034831 /ORGANISM="Rhizochromulina marina cf, Strain CCMP1243" /LENGTH=235 /DNA_ID=CAMNT_0006935563 /DNA_START=116 /DNA_END=823 /DNA_ORIENTATION=-